MRISRKQTRVLAIVTVVAAVLAMAACSGGDASQQEVAQLNEQLAEKEAEVTQLQSQIASMGSGTTIVVQPGQLAPAPAGAQPAGWDTAESIRGGLKLFAMYDSSGPDAWDVKAHPLVYIASEGTGTVTPSPLADKDAPYFVGFHIVDAYSKEVVTSFLINEPIAGDNINRYPHGFDVSPDGKWGYTSWSESGADRDYHFVGIVNMRTLKLDKVLTMERTTGWGITGRRAAFGTDSKPLHHVQAFWDWEGNPRVILQFGFGNRGGPHYILDPSDDNRVWKAITYDDVHPMGHPFTTPSPDGRYVYISMESNLNAHAEAPAAGIAKLDLKTGEVIVIEGVGHHPIGITHTADGRYTYVNDAHGSEVYKIDNETNEVVDRTSAGVAGPYGIALNWDETELYIVGKGEGSHNLGAVLGIVDTKTFRQSRSARAQMPLWLGGSAASVDHAILHPDPEVNELWVSDMKGWDTIVVDLDTHEAVDWIHTPHGGNTHSGCFVRYNPDWTGELQSDMGGPKSKAMWDLVKAKVAEATAAAQ